MLLLDTCALLWLGLSPDKITDHVREWIETKAKKIYYSPVSCLEIGIKVKKKKLFLAPTAQKWFTKLVSLYSLEELILDSHLSFESTLLPSIHQDPIDRLLIATAIHHNLVLATPDTCIRQYPAKTQLKVVW